jgi:hypothetical protein
MEVFMKSASLLLAVLMGAASLGATAQEVTGADPVPTERPGLNEGERQIQTFTEIDANSDGVLVEEEIEESTFTGDFSDLDRDDDGEVNRNEYYQYYRDQANQNR